MKVELTRLEKEVLLAVLHSDYQDGDNPVNNPVWWLDENDVDNMEPGQLSGAISSCVKKEYVVIDKSVRGEETIALTQLGYDLVTESISA